MWLSFLFDRFLSFCVATAQEDVSFCFKTLIVIAKEERPKLPFLSVAFLHELPSVQLYACFCKSSCVYMNALYLSH